MISLIPGVQPVLIAMENILENGRNAMQSVLSARLLTVSFWLLKC